MEIKFKIFCTVSGKSLVLAIEQNRYVFNLFEGFQRYMVEKKYSIKGITNVVLPSTDGIGSFIGAYLTLRDMNQSKISIMCREEIMNSIKVADKFSPKNNLNIEFNGWFEDKYVNIQFLGQNKTNCILNINKIEGKLLVEKIPSEVPKARYGELKRRQQIFVNNQMFDGNDYVEEDTRFNTILVLFDDSEMDSVSNIIKNESVRIFSFSEKVNYRLEKIQTKYFFINYSRSVDFVSQYEMTRELNKVTQCYLLPSSTPLSIPKYAKLVLNFGYQRKICEVISMVRSLKSIVQSKDLKRVKKICDGIKISKNVKKSIWVDVIQKSFKHIKKQLINQNLIHSNSVFKVLKKKRSSKIHLSYKSRSLKLIKINQFSETKSLIKRPKNQTVLNTGDTVNFVKETVSFFREKGPVYNQKFHKNVPKHNTITFLGTGCAIPSKYRNVTGILVDVFDKVVLFDAGEDTYFQILRIFGNDHVLNRLSMVFISHSHADHNLGLYKILKHVKQQVLVFCPKSFHEFLLTFNFSNVKFILTDEAKSLEKSFIKDFGLIDTSMDLTKNIPDIVKKYTMQYDDFFKVNICGCPHTKDSCSISIEFNGLKISYTGDSKPSLLFTLMAYVSDVMIHESTFDHNNAEKALKTGHSTIDQANIVFESSQSKHLLLTHFSQRYPKGFISKYKGFPCMDFFRFLITDPFKDTYKINGYLRSIQD